MFNWIREHSEIVWAAGGILVSILILVVTIRIVSAPSTPVASTPAQTPNQARPVATPVVPATAQTVQASQASQDYTIASSFYWFGWFGAPPNPVNKVDHAFGWFMILVFLDALLVATVMGYYLYYFKKRRNRERVLGPAWRKTKKWVCITNDVVLLYLIDLQLLFVSTMVLGATGKALFALWILCGVGVRLTRIHKATARGLFKAAAITQGIMAGVVIVFAAMMGGFGEVASFTSSTTGQWVSLALIAVTYGIFAKAMTPCWRLEELTKLERERERKRRNWEKDEEEHQGWLTATWARWFTNAANYATHAHENMRDDTGEDIREALKGTAPRRGCQPEQKQSTANGAEAFGNITKSIGELFTGLAPVLKIVAYVIIALLALNVISGWFGVRGAGASSQAKNTSTTLASTGIMSLPDMEKPVYNTRTRNEGRYYVTKVPVYRFGWTRVRIPRGRYAVRASENYRWDPGASATGPEGGKIVGEVSDDPEQFQLPQDRICGLVGNTGTGPEYYGKRKARIRASSGYVLLTINERWCSTAFADNDKKCITVRLYPL